MRILVTGGAGFIGSHVVDACVKAGHEVGIVDDLSTGVRENLNPRARFWHLDIRSAGLADVVAEFQPDVINHHAAQMSVGLSAKDPKWDADINILGALNLLEAAVRAGVQHVLFASTGGAMYGEQDLVPTPETTFPTPVSPYGVAKLAVERYLHAYRAMHGLRSTVLRYANVYGPRQNPHGEAGVVAIFARAILDGRPLTVNGDGLQTRDYVYVADVVDANMRALEAAGSGGRGAGASGPRAEITDQKEQKPASRRAAEGAEPEKSPHLHQRLDAGEPINIGTGLEAPVTDLVRHLEEIVGRRLDVRHGPPRAGEQRRSALDATRADRLLAWRPSTDLRTGLQRTYRWFAEAKA